MTAPAGGVYANGTLVDNTHKVNYASYDTQSLPSGTGYPLSVQYDAAQLMNGPTSSFFRNNTNSIENVSGQTLLCLVHYVVTFPAYGSGHRDTSIEVSLPGVGTLGQMANMSATGSALDATSLSGSAVYPVPNNYVILVNGYQNSGVSLSTFCTIEVTVL
jgi:hypothetical protein